MFTTGYAAAPFIYSRASLTFASQHWNREFRIAIWFKLSNLINQVLSKDKLENCIEAALFTAIKTCNRLRKQGTYHNWVLQHPIGLSDLHCA